MVTAPAAKPRPMPIAPSFASGVRSAITPRMIAPNAAPIARGAKKLRTSSELLPDRSAGSIATAPMAADHSGAPGLLYLRLARMRGVGSGR